MCACVYISLCLSFTALLCTLCTTRFLFSNIYNLFTTPPIYVYIYMLYAILLAFSSILCSKRELSVLFCSLPHHFPFFHQVKSDITFSSLHKKIVFSPTKQNLTQYIYTHTHTHTHSLFPNKSTPAATRSINRGNEATQDLHARPSIRSSSGDFIFLHIHSNVKPILSMVKTVHILFTPTLNSQKSISCPRSQTSFRFRLSQPY